VLCKKLTDANLTGCKPASRKPNRPQPTYLVPAGSAVVQQLGGCVLVGQRYDAFRPALMVALLAGQVVRVARVVHLVARHVGLFGWFAGCCWWQWVKKSLVGAWLW
jgi:hypothetical protein